MRRIASFAVVLAAGGILLGANGQAYAGPAVVAAPMVTSELVAQAGSRRHCRRYGCGPEVMLPGAALVPGVEVDEAVVPGAEVDEVDIDVGVDVPAVVVLPPPRPISCGQYRYWNGVACVDARYTDPYIGPK